MLPALLERVLKANPLAPGAGVNYTALTPVSDMYKIRVCWLEGSRWTGRPRRVCTGLLAWRVRHGVLTDRVVCRWHSSACAA